MFSSANPTPRRPSPTNWNWKTRAGSPLGMPDPLDPLGLGLPPE